MSDCVFCKVVSKELPSKQEHEDDVCVVFYDIHPKSSVHLLVVPKKHIPTIMDLGEGDEKIMGHLIRVAQSVAQRLGLEGFKLQFNVGEKGGQEVFHIHMHLLA